MLYQLSYDTRNICLKCGCKDTHFFKSGKFLSTKKCISRKNNLPLQHLCEGKLHSAKPSKLVSALVCITFAPSNDKDRNVAQLVAHYVRDVGVGRSSRLIPTKERKLIQISFRFFLCLIERPTPVRCGELKQGFRVKRGRSSRLIPTEKGSQLVPLFLSE